MEPKTFRILVEKCLDRWCVWESSVPGLFLETDSWTEMRACIEEIAPELIVQNTDIQEDELSTVQFHVFCKDRASQDSAKTNKPVILLEPQLAA